MFAQIDPGHDTVGCCLPLDPLQVVAIGLALMALVALGFVSYVVIRRRRQPN